MPDAPDSLLRRLAAKAWHSPTITTWSSFAITALNFFLLLPLAFNRLPTGDFAFWLLMGSLTNFQAILTFGLTPTFTRLVAYAAGGRRVEEFTELPTTERTDAEINRAALREIAGTTHAIFLGVGVVSLLLGATLGTWLLVRPVGFTTQPSLSWAAWGIFLVGNVLTIAGSGFGIFLMGLNHVALMQRWQTGLGILSVAVCSFVLWSGGGLFWLVVASQFFLVLTVARNFWLCRRVDGGDEAVATRPQFSRRIWDVTWPASWRSGLATAVYFGFIQLSGPIFAQFASAVAVANYLFLLRVVQTVSSTSQAPFYSKIPRLARLLALGQRAELVQQAQRGMTLAYWTFVLGIAALFIAGGPALQLVGKGKYAFDYGLLSLLAVAIFFERFSGMNLQLVGLTNRIYGHIGCLGASTINLVVCLLLGPRLGIHAFGLGLVCGQIGFQAGYAAVKVKQKFDLGPWAFNRRVSLPPFLVLVVVIALYFLFS